MRNPTTKNQIQITDKTDTLIACVDIMGAKRGCGWRYCLYTRAKNGGWKYSNAATCGMYPNKDNYNMSQAYEAKWTAAGIPIVDGRP